jgi:hypothetical protein
VHARTVSSRFGTRDVRWLRENVDPQVRRVDCPPKFKYALGLTPEMRARLAILTRPFPKREQGAQSGTPATRPGGVSIRPARSMRSGMPDVMTPTCQARTAHGPCGAGAHEARDGICAKGHALPGNALRRTHGLYSFRDRGEGSLPPDMRMTVAEFKSAVISDRGGPEELSAIEAARIGHLAEIETTLRLLASDLATRGLMTAKGRVRSTFTRWLEALDRWERLAGHIGDGRRARQVPSLAAYLAQASKEQPSKEDA